MLVRIRHTWGHVHSRAASFVAQHFPERQLMLRSRGELTYVPLSPKTQIIGLATGTAISAWVVFASVGLLVQNYMIDARDDRLAGINQAYQSLHGEMSHVQNRFLAATEAIEAKHDRLARMVDEKQSIESRVKDAATADVSKKAQTSNKQVVANTASAPNSHLRAPINNPVNPEFVNVGGRLASVMESHSDLISQLQERTRNNVSDLETAIQVTGLDLDRLLADTPNSELASPSMGGPLLRLPDSDLPTRADDGFDLRVQALTSHLSRLSGLESAVQSLPLIPPVNHYYISSNFGKRRDPVTRQWSMHSGLDLAGVRKTPVVATAPGIVTYARRKGPYGKMVEIDHGQGLKSRYGHLHKILVKKGDKVAFRQKIGQMGSTGRTTGPHVHYEIWVDGKPRNPAKFLKAGQNVFNQ